VNILSYDITILTNLVAGNHEFYKTFQNILPVDNQSEDNEDKEIVICYMHLWSQW